MTEPGRPGRESDGPSPQGGSPAQVASGRRAPDLLADGLGYGELKRLLPLIREQYEPILSKRKTICIAGPVNTGKSSLYNALVTDPGDRTRVSPVPGTTRHSQTGDAGAFRVIDTPGANEMVVGSEGPRASAERHAEAINSAAGADLLVIVFDAARGIAHDEVAIYAELTGLGKPAIVVLNKIDLVRSEQDAVVKAAAHNLQITPEEVIPTSALRHTNLDRLILAIVNTDPQLLATLAEAIPRSRWLLANNTILSACGAVGTANLLTSPVQVPFASFVPITAIQVAMVLRLARVFGFRLTPGRAKEILLAMGSGLLGRTLFYQLVDLVPVAGYVLGTAIAAGTTAAIGYSVATWFAYGEQPSAEKVRALSEALTQVLLERLKQMPNRRAIRRDVRKAVADALAKVAGDE